LHPCLVLIKGFSFRGKKTLVNNGALFRSNKTVA
jgi:hypothetical protein